ncbi:uncharacterized protein [Drosophila virilis]|uniref:Single domain-containing protein n=1 Tax=Drosophila virilis TaxID=7244 RepID=A0A0Q9WB23_DROVI|nr:uncharacterized protein LOC26530818 [Drosophila virilis]KRF81939.1 uncharacterized protein Dvir_GJ26048 [Drosophila virilis]
MSPLMVGLILALVLLLHSEHPVAADAYHAIFKHDDYPNKCYVELPKGDKLLIESDQYAHYPGKCAEIYCGRNSWALVYACDTKYPPKDCEYGEHKYPDAPYPKCCSRLVKCNTV